MTRAERNGLIDLLRLVGALGIVAFHTTTFGKSFTYAALPMFIILLVAFQGESRDFPSLVRGRARRLLWPWLVWSGLYVLLWAAQWIHGGKLPPLRWSMLLTGPVISLWFLPFAFLCACLTFPLDRLMRQGKWRLLGWLVLPGILPAFALLPAGLPTPLAQWGVGLASVAFGLAIRWNRRLPMRLVAILGLLTVSALLALWVAPRQTEAGAIWLGGGLVVLALSWDRFPSTRWTEACAPISFLVYLVHPAVAVGAWFLQPEASSWQHGLSIQGGSLAFAILAWRTGLTRWLL